MRIRSVTVGPDRVDVVVCLGDLAAMRTSADEGVPARAIELLPGLASHRCMNSDGRSFSDEIGDTEVPHLFEHVALELMAESGSPRNLKGHTEWDFERDGCGVFHVSLQYDDDLVCLGAIKAADRVMRCVLEGGEVPDVAAEIERLRRLREVP